ncbi:3-oxoacyl-[acyl-carrier- ] synthase, mitochondrial, partial [Paramuricea clavata]
RGSGTNSATLVSLYIYFLPTLIQVEIDNDNLGRQFRAGLVSSTGAGVQRLTLRNRYVLARNNQPTPAANVADVNECSSSTRCGPAQRCENYDGTYRCYCNRPAQMITESGQCINVITFQGVLIITNLGTFDPSLLIINSIPWLRLALSLESAINAAYRRSNLASNYRGCQVTRFREGSVIATYLATFDPASKETVSNAQAAIQTQLSENVNGTFLGQYQLSGTRQTAIMYQDYDECNPASNIHIQDCGTGATCTNEVGTYSCQCATGYTGTPPNCT